MRRFLTTSFLGFLGIAMIIFFFANRQDVVISMDPTSLESPAIFMGPMPMWAALVGTMSLGLGFGALGMWLSAGSLRQKARERKREIKRLQHELSLVSSPPPSGSTQLTTRDNA